MIARHNVKVAMPTRRHSMHVIAVTLLTLTLVLACTGPEERGAVDPTSTPTITPTATEVPPTPTPTASPTATLEPIPTATATQEPSPTATTAPSPTPETSATPASSPTVGVTPTVEDIGLSAELPTLEDLEGSGYQLLEEGTRSAQDLANAYADPGAHLQRLQDWGFSQHVFRSFLRPGGNEGDPEPDFILATVNEYGSPEQAEDALVWLFRLGTTQGAAEAEAPEIGDSRVALTVPTSDGQPTASVYVRRDQFVFIFFAQGGEPLPAMTGLAERVFSR